MSDALAVAHDHVGPLLEPGKRLQHRRDFPKRQQSRHVRKARVRDGPHRSTTDRSSTRSVTTPAYMVGDRRLYETSAPAMMLQVASGVVVSMRPASSRSRRHRLGGRKVPVVQVSELHNFGFKISDCRFDDNTTRIRQHEVLNLKSLKS